MRLAVEERVFILESYLKTMSYVHKYLGVVCHGINKLVILKYGPYGPILSWTLCRMKTSYETFHRVYPICLGLRKIAC